MQEPPTHRGKSAGRVTKGWKPEEKANRLLANAKHNERTLRKAPPVQQAYPRVPVRDIVDVVNEDAEPIERFLELQVEMRQIPTSLRPGAHAPTASGLLLALMTLSFFTGTMADVRDGLRALNGSGAGPADEPASHTGNTKTEDEHSASPGAAGGAQADPAPARHEHERQVRSAAAGQHHRHHHHDPSHDHDQDHTRRRGDDHAQQDPNQPHAVRRGDDHRRQHFRPSEHARDDAGGHLTAHNATVYPNDTLSEYMQQLLISVRSFDSVIAPRLRQIGFEPDELLEFTTTHISGLDSMSVIKRWMTPIEVAEHYTTTERHGYTLHGESSRANELIRKITNRKKYKRENFFTKEGLTPIRNIFKKIGQSIILDKLTAFGVKKDDKASLKWINAHGRLNSEFGAAHKPTSGTLGALLEVEKDGAIQRFAILPHHRDMVLHIPHDHDRWKSWMHRSGKNLFFKNPENLPAGVHFSTRQDEGDDYYPADTVGEVIEHILKPIIRGTVQHLSALVTRESTFEEAIHSMVGLYIPGYDFMRALSKEDFGGALVFLSFELIPYVGSAAKKYVKVAFKGTTLPAATQTFFEKWLPDGYAKFKDLYGLGLLKYVKPAARGAIQHNEESPNP
jgi:hypothetical protein